MKKLLLLALTISSAATLTACNNEPTIDTDYEDVVVETASLYSIQEKQTVYIYDYSQTTPLPGSNSRLSLDLNSYVGFENDGKLLVSVDSTLISSVYTYVGFEDGYYVYESSTSACILSSSTGSATSGLLSSTHELRNAEIYYAPYSEEPEITEPEVEEPEVEEPSIDSRSLTTNINENKSLSDILTELELSSATILSDEYTSNRTTVGTHEVIVSTDGITTTIYISVVDTDAPTITGSNSYTTDTDTKLSVDTIKSNLTATDNSTTDLELVVKNDYYSNNWNKTGTYSIIFTATDYSNNTTEYVVTIYVNDIVAPTISGNTTYIKNPNVVLTLQDIINGLSASDNVDGNLTNSIVVKTDGYTGKASTVGNYSVVVEVTDNAGNTTEQVITIEVTNSVANMYIANNSTIVVYDNVTLSNTDLIDVLKKLGYVGTSSGATNQYVVSADNYYNNSNTAGSYVVTYSTSSSDGTSYAGSLTINVLDSGGMESEQNSLGFFDTVKNFFINLWQGISNFFSGLGSFFLSKWYLFLIPIVGLGVYFYKKK